MKGLLDIMIGSLKLLKDRPVLFVPKIVSSLIASLWLVGFLELFFSGFGSLYFYGVTAPLMIVSGVFAPVMLAVMVKETGSSNLLRTGFFAALSRWKGIFVSTIFLMVIFTIVSLPLSFGLTFTMFTGQLVPLVFGTLLTLLLILPVAFLIYFFPISFVEEGSVIKGFRDSAGTSVNNSGDVMVLTMLSFGLLGIAFLAGNQEVRAVGFASFVLARVFSSVVATYIFVVSPKYYLAKN